MGKKASSQAVSQLELGCSESKPAPAKAGPNGQLLPRWLIFDLGRATGTDMEKCL